MADGKTTLKYLEQRGPATRVLATPFFVSSSYGPFASWREARDCRSRIEDGVALYRIVRRREESTRES